MNRRELVYTILGFIAFMILYWKLLSNTFVPIDPHINDI